MKKTTEELRGLWFEDFKKEFESKKELILNDGKNRKLMETAIVAIESTIKEKDFITMFEFCLELCTETIHAYEMTDIAREIAC